MSSSESSATQVASVPVGPGGAVTVIAISRSPQK
jgi:hypothetical protein